MTRRAHSMPFGAQANDNGSVRFRLWAPAATCVELCLEAERPRAMTRQAEGWFELSLPAAAGSRYRYRIDGGAEVPDPASRHQPEDVHGPSAVVDPRSFHWQDDDWCGRPWHEAVCYELHVGSFSPEGSFDGVRARLDHLAALGVTALQLMPLADFPGSRNWGYDGVYPFAPEAGYGPPEALKRLVDAAHRRGLMVFLDVVYNHFGPEGNYLNLYAPQVFHTDRHTPWGAAIDFDGPHSRWVREFFVHNALYWLEEYHLDGLRLDAVHAIEDRSRPDFLEQLATEVRRRLDPRRQVHLVLEDDANRAHYLARDDSAPRLYSAQWNDDFHHALHVLTTGEANGVYADYADAPLRHLLRCLAEGFAYQGEPSVHRGGTARGEPSADLPPAAFVTFLQTHDQAGNRPFGERLGTLVPEAAYGALTALLLLAPFPPLLFMGQEWCSRQPFPFFCDFEPPLAAAIREGRLREFAHRPEFAAAATSRGIADPTLHATFERARLDWAEAHSVAGSAWLALHRELLAIRAERLVPRLANARGGTARATAIGERALRAEWELDDGSRLYLLANLAAAPLEQAPALPGETLYALPETAASHQTGRSLPPWSVIWRLQPAAAASRGQTAPQR